MKQCYEFALTCSASSLQFFEKAFKDAQEVQLDS
jgi:hypothetical protein